MSDAAGVTTFQITKTELYLPVVTLNTENNKKLSDLLKKDLKDRYFGMNIKIKSKNKQQEMIMQILVQKAFY